MRLTEEPWELPLALGRLCGSLAVPAGDGPWPLAVLVSGSGPTDRDGNNPLLPVRCDHLKLLAESLARHGIASLRYDKRGVGESVFPGLNEAALRFDDLVGDAVAVCGAVRGDPRFGALVLVGHSEGALIAALAAPAAQAAAFVSLAGAGERASTLMRAQIRVALPPDLELAAQAALDALEAQRPAEGVPAELALLFRDSVQPYLMSWFRHDPAEVMAQAKVPVLLVHGTTDAQVPMAHAQRLHDATPQARLHVVKGMDHLLAVQGDVRAGTALVAAEVAAWLQALRPLQPA